MSFENKVAFIAGGGGGMGLAIADGLIERGCHVATADLKPDGGNFAPGPGRHVHFAGDLSEQGFVESAVAAAAEAFGGIDYLVNTAGVLWLDRDTSVTGIDMDVWDRVLAVNLRSFVLTARYCVPLMQARGGGAMVHFSSIDATGGDAPAQDAYGASKAAVIRLAKSLAIQFAGDGIRSNVILPGPTTSPMQARWRHDAAAQARVAGLVPLGRVGTVADMAAACLFLLSEEAGYITGVELPVDGGVTARV
jgi:NAD(P)-dependent dehydrogenase (short-subunit alcohol dehydrogenase family)